VTPHQRNWKSDFYEIRQFLGGYFPQDFKVVNGSPGGALAAALRDHSEAEKRALIDELTTLLAIRMPEAEREELFYGPLGCDYNVAANGYTPTTWLTYVKGRFEESLTGS